MYCKIMAQNMLGRELLPGEVVHHQNGDPSDDREENLLVMTDAEHKRLHLKENDYHRRAA